VKNWAWKSELLRLLIVALTAFWLIPTGFAQGGRITLSGSYGPAPLPEILKQIRNDYGIRFAFDPDVLGTEIAEGTFSEATIDQVLFVLLRDRGLTWKTVRRTVLIFQDAQSVDPDRLPQEKVNFTWTIRIVDAENGEPLPFAAGIIRYPPMIAEADSDGRLTFRSVPSDTCSVRVRYTGYEDRVIRLNSGAAIKATLGLKSGSNTLPAALIEGRAPDMVEPAMRSGILTFNPSDLVAISTNGETDVLRGVQMLPGVMGTSESSNGLIIRGSSADQSLVQFDDFTIFHLDHFFGLFSAINADAVKQVRVYKGGFDASQGGRAGGIVRVAGKEGNRIRPSGQLTIGSLSGSLLLESPVGEKGAIVIAGRRSYLELLPTPVFRSLYTTAYRQGPGAIPEEDVFTSDNPPRFSFQDLTAKYTWRSGRGDKVSVSGYAGRDNLEHAVRTSMASGGTIARFSDQSSWGNTGAGARWQRDLTRNRKWLSTAGVSSYRSSYFASDTLINPLSGQVSTAYRDEELRLLDYTMRVEYASFLGKVRLSPGIHLNGNSIDAAGPNASRLLGSANVLSGYVQAERDGEVLSLRAGGRLSYFSRFRRAYPEWRFSGVWRLTKSWSVKVASSRMHQFIHRVRPQSLNQNHADLWLISGDAGIPVLRSDLISSGLTWKQGNWTLDAEAWVRFNTGVYEYLPTELMRPPSGDSLLFGNGTAYGLDVLAGWHIRGWHAWLSYSLGKTANWFAGYDPKGIPGWFDQRHEIKIYAQREWKKWDAAITWILGSGRPYTPALGAYSIPLAQGGEAGTVIMGDLYSARLPVYHRLDIAGGWSTERKGITYGLRASLFNAYNHRNVRDVRYLGVQGQGQPLMLVQEEIHMLGIMPSLQFQIKW